MRSHFAVTSTAIRTPVWIMRLRSIRACRSSSKNESGGRELSFSNMLGPRHRMGGRCFCDEGIAAEDSPWLMRCLRASGLACLKERLAPAGGFLEISWRYRKSADVRDLGGAYGGSGSGRRRE